MNNSAQRPSPSSPHLQADNHEEAREGLDVTACSASSFANSKWLSHWERMKEKDELGLKYEGDEFWVRAIEDHGLDKSTFPYDEMNDLLNNHKGTNLWLKRLQEMVHAIGGRTFYDDLRTSSGSNP
jgi:hypothetical protein